VSFDFSCEPDESLLNEMEWCWLKVSKIHQCSGGSGGGNSGIISSSSPRGNQSPCKSPVIPSTHAFTPLMLTPNPSPISSGYGLSAKTLFWNHLKLFVRRWIKIYGLYILPTTSFGKQKMIELTVESLQNVTLYIHDLYY